MTYSLRHIRSVDAEAGPESGITAHRPRLQVVVGGARSHARMQGPNGSGQLQLEAREITEGFRHTDDPVVRILNHVGRVVRPVVLRILDHL